tara:strand:+ start:85204 stop:85344 length:141 start_codon:yes stop_codon:yes gene_type:complete
VARNGCLNFEWNAALDWMSEAALIHGVRTADVALSMHQDAKLKSVE